MCWDGLAGHRPSSARARRQARAAVSQLPKAKQQFVSEMLETVLGQGAR